jgi:hypothetical protein
MSDQSPFDASPVVVAPVVAVERVEAAALSPATQRFHACRWHKPAENGTAPHCTHRDVLPLAGVAGFSADSWCTDCGHYKLRRTVRKTAYS